MIAAIIITELLIVVKFDWDTITKPLPTHVTYGWILGFSFLLIFTVWKFYIFRDVKSDLPVESLESNGRLKNNVETRKYQNGATRNFNLRSRQSRIKQNQLKLE